MNEIHSIEFVRFGVNILSDEQRGVILLQFDISACGVGLIEPILKAIWRRFGHGIWGHLSRRMTRAGEVLLVTTHAQHHPDYPEVIRVEMIVKEGERMDAALGTLLDFFRHQPGYCRTLGSPLDPDAPHGRVRSGTGDTSSAAADTLRRMLERRRRKEPQS